MDEEQRFLQNQQWANRELLDLVDLALQIGDLDSPSPQNAASQEALQMRLVMTATVADGDSERLGGILLAAVHLHRAMLRAWAQDTGQEPEEIWRGFWPNLA